MPPATEILMTNYYIIFAGIIEPGFGTRLVSAINSAAQKGATRIVLLLSSLGGNIQEGFTLASVIQNSSIPVSIHATNNIDSIANVIYLSAKERTAESYAKFYMHGATCPPVNFDEKGLREQLLAIRTENTRIAYFISENCSLSLRKVQNMMKVGTTMSAQQALQYGIVQSINHVEVPPGAPREEIVAIN
jgi:ATP-dependent protease ClpP protease subunit